LPQKERHFRLSVPSESQFLDVIRDFVGKLATIAGFEEEYVNKIQLAVDEACTNVVKHAYRGRRKAGKLDVEVVLNASTFRISVIDYGRGFDVNKILKRDINNHLLEFRRGGLGIHLMRILMDEVNFSICPGKENRVELVKYRNRKDSPEKQQKQRLLMERSHERE